MGLDSVDVKSHVEIRHALRKHFNMINSIQRFTGSIKVFIPENNLGNEATHMNSMITDMEIHTYWQTEKRPGVNKDAKATVNYQFLTDTKLQHCGIRFDVDCFTTNAKFNIESQKATLREQMERYHYVYDADRDTQKLTGKMGKNKQDDLLIAFMQGLYYGRANERDPRRLK